MSAPPAAATVASELRAILAALTGRDELQAIPDSEPLFGGAVSLDSLTGTLLLREVQRRFGVDVAAEDLNLDALATVGTLAAFICDHALLARGSDPPDAGPAAIADALVAGGGRPPSPNVIARNPSR